MPRSCIHLIWSTAIVLGAAASVSAQTMGQSAAASPPTLTALAQAGQANKYAFIFFWKTNDDQTRRMFGLFQETMQKITDSAAGISVNAANPNETAVVEKFGVSRAPMPLVLAIAPNGAVTQGVSVNFTAEQLQKAFVSPATANCLKAIQDRKLVVLCIQNQQSLFRQASYQAAQDFRTDARFAASCEVVTLDPQDPREASFLQALEVDANSPQATTILLAPPGKPIARFVGNVSKDEIAAKLAAAQSSCCPGGTCGPGGCKPQ